MTIIALTGLAGAGKDTTADVLVNYARFTKLAFADPLRAEVAAAFDIEARTGILEDRATKEQPHDALALRHCRNFCFIGAVAIATHATVNSQWLDQPRSPRQILQWWGTEYRRAEDPQYWIKAMASRINVRREGGHQRFVLTDCRFPNELAYVRSAGGKLWRVLRPGLAAVEGAHASATSLQLEQADLDLANDGMPDQLRSQVLQQWWATDSGIPAARLRVEVLA